jgi:hypothetical protein
LPGPIGPFDEAMTFRLGPISLYLLFADCSDFVVRQHCLSLSRIHFLSREKSADRHLKYTNPSFCGKS